MSARPSLPGCMADSDAPERRHLCLEGVVQGVGFRPHVYRLARACGLTGWVSNSAAGVEIEVEGPRVAITTFRQRLENEPPPLASLSRMHESEALDPHGYPTFEIRDSESSGPTTARMLPDIATCDECLAEILDPDNRRYRYPFTNCTHCGPRFSILKALPYDRHNTTMAKFRMCPTCQAEYEDPGNRRFHAQPNACPECGPQLALSDAHGEILAHHDQALLAAAAAIRTGKIVALKGLGGFQLLVDARSAKAVARLRQRKSRPHKAFAVMFPSLSKLQAHCETSSKECALLSSPQAPIVLLRRHSQSPDTPLAVELAPDNPLLGAMLPYTPLHHLLLRELGFAVVATSGNLAEEPMVIDEEEALQRLAGIADVFLIHDRPIARAVDDSVARIMADEITLLRRARGYAPASVELTVPGPPVLALGGHLKAVVALSHQGEVVIGSHIGDLGSTSARKAFTRATDDLLAIRGQAPVAIACDLHPDYYSTQVAGRYGPRVVPVQHHLAHVLSCMAEHGLHGPVLGIAWDGSGYGEDGKLWGGEFFLVEGTSARRIAHLHPFRLPGGERAIREPRRSALGLLYELYGEAWPEVLKLAPLQHLGKRECTLIRTMLTRHINSPETTSIGRLFDGIAALLDLGQTTSFEGQAAMALEFSLNSDAPSVKGYPLPLVEPENPTLEPLVLDWRPMLQALLKDIDRDTPTALLAARFHNGLVAAIVALARHVNIPQVVLSGGCFQNAYLTTLCVAQLREAGFTPYWHHRVPPNDGGLALGQAAWATRLLNEEHR